MIAVAKSKSELDDKPIEHFTHFRWTKERVLFCELSSKVHIKYNKDKNSIVIEMNQMDDPIKVSFKINDEQVVFDRFIKLFKTYHYEQ